MPTGTTKTKHGTLLATIATLILAGIAGRLIPHAPNATPLTALALVSGAALGGYLGLIVPVMSLLFTDLLIGTYATEVMISVYLCFMLPVIFGRLVLKKDRRPWLVSSLAVVSSAIFFLTTNFTIWYFGNWYPPTWQGLIACYTAALPFAVNMIVADLVWSALLFSALALIEGRSLLHWSPNSLKA